jgi:tetratricopeptide (TPR) repeat protein
MPICDGGRAMRRFLSCCGLLAAVLVGTAAHAAPLTRGQALAAMEQEQAETRLAGIDRLAEIGRMADAQRLLESLHDDDPRVREAASVAVWRVWSRSGDPAIDKLFARGVEQMRAEALDEALRTFSEIVRRKPAFAEGWNKRATIYFLLGQHEKSLADCAEVFRRNRNHFGALAGAGQIHLQMGDLQRALAFFRRALEINPDLDGPAQAIPLLEQRLGESERSTI